MLVGMKSGKAILKFGPYALPDEDLKKLKTPTLLIYGDKEVMYAADRAIKRAEELVENIQTALIPNASARARSCSRLESARFHQASSAL